MGRASRLKRERKDLPSDRRLLMTLTNEPVQPVRLYYSIPDRDSVSERLRTLECLVEAPDEQCWQWLFQAEAASLRFGGGYEDVPKERRPSGERRTWQFLAGAARMRIMACVMFMRATTRKKDGKVHRYFSVVENQRVRGGRVVQRHVPSRIALQVMSGWVNRAWPAQ